MVPEDIGIPALSRYGPAITETGVRTRLSAPTSAADNRYIRAAAASRTVAARADQHPRPWATAPDAAAATPGLLEQP